MLGKVRVIQAIAGRSSAKELNAPMMTAITAAKFPEDSYQTTSIIISKIVFLPMIYLLIL